jgi:hypothetical protein
MVCYNDNVFFVFEFEIMSRPDGGTFWKIFGAKKEEITGGLRRLHEDDFHVFYPLRNMRLAECVADREMYNKTLIGKGNGKITHGRSTLRGVMMLFKKSSITLVNSENVTELKLVNLN